MVGREEVAGEHRRAVPGRRRGTGAGTSLPAQAARAGTKPTPCAHGEPDVVEVASPVRRAAARRPPADKAGTGASPLTLRAPGLCWLLADTSVSSRAGTWSPRRRALVQCPRAAAPGDRPAVVLKRLRRHAGR